MELDFAILADGAMTRPEGKFDIIGAGFDTIFAAAVPARHARFVLVVRLGLSADEAADSHEVAVGVSDLEGNEIARAGGPVTPVPDEYRAQAPPEGPIGVGIVINSENVIFPAYGMYHVSPTWDA